MTPNQEQIDRALEFAAAGAPYDACEQLWPLVRDPARRDQALFTMAYCFERAGNLPTAAYLYDWVAQRHPAFNVAAHRRDVCNGMLGERGILEDFSDSGHVDCPCGDFRYRAELGLCPYCGRRPGEAEDDVAAEEAEGSLPVHVPPEERDRDVFEEVRDQLEHAWSTMRGRFGAFLERDDLGDVGQRVQSLARQVSGRTKALAEHERTREVRQKLGEVGKDAAERLRDVTQSPEAQRLAAKSRALGENATGQVKSLSEKEEIRNAQARLVAWTSEAADRLDAWAKSESVRETGHRLYATLEAAVDRMQGYIDRAKGVTPEHGGVHEEDGASEDETAPEDGATRPAGDESDTPGPPPGS